MDDNKVSYLVGKHEIFDLPCKNQGVLSMVSAVLGRHFGQDGLVGALVGFGGVFGAWSLLQQEEQEIFDLPCKKGFWEHGAEALGREFSEIVLSPQRRAHFCIASF